MPDVDPPGGERAEQGGPARNQGQVDQAGLVLSLCLPRVLRDVQHSLLVFSRLSQMISLELSLSLLSPLSLCVCQWTLFNRVSFPRSIYTELS